jgi:peptide/nickel transport system substrate-binding protein
MGIKKPHNFLIIFFIFIIIQSSLFSWNKIVIGKYSLEDILFPIVHYNQQEVLFNCFSRIVSLDNTGSIIADLADRWEVKENHTKYIFYIRDNVFFHDGAKLTSKDIKSSIEYNIKMSFNLLSPEIKEIKGVNKFLKGRANNIRGIRAEQKKVIFIFRNPAPNFLKTLTNLNLSIYKIKDGKYIGTGPYIRTKSFKKGKIVNKIIMKKNHKYFIDIKDSPEYVELTTSSYYKDINRYDIVFFEKNKVKDKDLKNFNIEEIPTATIELLIFNLRSYWGKNKNFRKFLVFSYDYRKIIDKYHLDRYNQPNIIPTGYSFYREIPQFPGYDKRKGAIFLKKIKNKKHPITILTVDRLHRKEMAIDIKNQLIRKGFKVNLINNNFTEFSEKLKKIIFTRTDNSTDIMFAAILLSTPPYTVYNYLYSLFYPNADNNAADYRNPKIIKLLDRLKYSYDIKERKKIVIKIIKIFNDDVPIIPLYTRTVYFFRKKRIKKFPLDFSKYIDYREIKIK